MARLFRHRLDALASGVQPGLGLCLVDLYMALEQLLCLFCASGRDRSSELARARCGFRLARSA